MNDPVVLRLSKAEAGSTFGVQTVEDCFAPITTVESWFGEEEKSAAAQAEKLEKDVKASLSELKSYRVISPKDNASMVLLIGRTEEGDYAGISARVVET